ncbi:MAG: serine/threonine protein kinase [Myxococcota bacterium]|nr:serine/threonine protein kinase [Myxococcota bacterium]
MYRAIHREHGTPFALKLISPACALDQLARVRFNEEARLASEITHPNIVSVVDFGEDPTLGAYMVMELVEGEPLIGHAGAPMDVRRVCDVLGQIAEALHHIHHIQPRGIIHGDVKAENILMTVEPTGARRRRVARLLDFGLARRGDGAHEAQVRGSPHYLAPERAAGQPPSVAADIYALGVLGYLMLTGAFPFAGNVVEIMMAHLNQVPDAPSARRGERIEPGVEALITHAMAKQPANRHRSAADFHDELSDVMKTLGMARRRHPIGTLPPDAR